ncbi:hypothetical protein WL22_18845 [Burkholderia ubonensis]|nr:hypothetical protein WL19_19715 [Burkholderia ubonensis]KVZ85663.1 hypothetical protein WL24_10305 [Burkholderia ubonensis]KVZ93793.1 hypothetical protein WL22_18845 [Burkholderia ubonensis]
MLILSILVPYFLRWNGVSQRVIEAVASKFEQIDRLDETRGGQPVGFDFFDVQFCGTVLPLPPT